MLKPRSLRAHVPAHTGDLVGLVVAVARHNYRVLELIVDRLLNFDQLGCLSGVLLALLGEAEHLLINQLETVVD